jgi:AcrR family transcriptional regulator
MTDQRSIKGDATRRRIVSAAMRSFAANGYGGARIDGIAAEAGVAKGLVLAHFGSKAGLFVAAYRAAVGALPRYLDAPPETRSEGFFAVLRYWLERTEHLVREDWVPYRVSLIGNHGTDLDLKREINRFLTQQDPYGTAAFVAWGVERGEVRDDIPTDMIVGVIDWLMERFQDAQVTEELDPGLFRRPGGGPSAQAARINQFLELLRSAVVRPGPRRERRTGPVNRGTSG